MMKKLLVILCITTIAMRTYTMEIDIMEISTITWLPLVPHDILELIGTFLTHDEIETKEEFIHRIQNPIPNNNTLIFPECRGKKLLFAYSPHKDKGILLSMPNTKKVFPTEVENKRTVSTIDTKTNRLIHQENVPSTMYNAIALSQDGNTYATISFEPDIIISGKFCTAVPRYKTILCIKNIYSSQEEQPYKKFKSNDLRIKSFILHEHSEDPYGFTSPSLYFNKQGTSLMIRYHTNNKSTHNITKEQFIFFKKNNKACNIDNIQHSLDKYFAYHTVCKNLTQQLALTK